MIHAECVGGPLDGEICPLYWAKFGNIYDLCGGDWPNTTKTGTTRRLRYVYEESKRLVFKKYVGS